MRAATRNQVWPS